MDTKFRLIKLTFIVLSIMCLILLASTSIIYAITGLNQNDTDDLANSTLAQATQTSAETAAPTASVAIETQTTPLKPSPKPTTESNKSSDETKTNITNPSITISAVGDLMAHQSNLNNAYNPKTNTYSFTGFLEYIKPYISQSDLTIGNFETVTAGSKYGYTSFPKFNTPDEIIPALFNAGFDILSTSNNHCLDMGVNGLIRTISKIQENKMINVGSSIDGKNKHITKEVNGLKISILSYSYSFNGQDAKLTADQKAKHLSPINEAQIKNDISTVRKNGTDAVIVIIHWGTEYQREPNKSQTALAAKLFNWGADIILGSHPHVLQKSEIVKVAGKDKFIIYSMGNFISGYRRVDKAKRPNKIYTEDGVVVQLKIEKDPNGGVIIKQIDYVPTWVDKYYVNSRPVFKIIPIPVSDPTGPYITNNNKNFITQSYKNTMSIMTRLIDK